MSNATPCHLTAKDVSVLEGMMARLETQAQTDTALARLLRQKLAAARICFSDDIDPRAATINSRVQFRVGSGGVETRVLTHGGESALPGTALPIADLYGLALLGLMEGDTIAVETADGRTDRLHVVRVVHQPEAARRTMPRANLRLVTGSQTGPRQASSRPEGPDDDDPGPRAA